MSTLQIVIQRLADQIPSLIYYFLLKQSVQLLCNEMLSLVGEVELDRALREGSDTGQRRVHLQKRMEKLSKALEDVSEFL